MEVPKRMMISPYCWPGTFRFISAREPEERELKPLAPIQVMNVVCDYYRLDPADNDTRKSRKGVCVKARFMTYHFVRKYCDGASFLDCSMLFGGYDHTQALYGVNSIQARIKTDTAIEFEAMQLETLIKTIK